MSSFIFSFIIGVVIYLASLLLSLLGLLWGVYQSRWEIWLINLMGLCVLGSFLCSGYFIFKQNLKQKSHWLVFVSIVGILAGLGLLHWFRPNGPWHPLATHNDAGLFLTYADEISRGLKPLMVFTWDMFGRVALTMNIEAMWMFFFGKSSQPIIFANQFITIFVVYFFANKIMNWPSKNIWVHGVLVFLFTLVIHPVWAPTSLLDMYAIAPVWLVLSMACFLKDQELSARELAAAGCFMGFGFLICPATKLIAPAFVVALAIVEYRKCHDLKKLVPLLAGVLIPLITVLGSIAQFREIFFYRETYLLENKKSVADYSGGLYRSLGENVKIFYEYFSLNRGFRHMYAHNVPIFGALSLASIFSLFYFTNRKLRILFSLVIFISVVQVFVTSPKDYRVYHMLPLLGLGVMLILLRCLDLKSKHIQYYWLAGAIMFLGYSVESDKFLKLDLKRRANWFCFDESYAKQLTPEYTENVQYIFHHTGNCEFWLGRNSPRFEYSQKNVVFGQNIQFLTQNWFRNHEVLNLLVPTDKSPIFEVQFKLGGYRFQKFRVNSKYRPLMADFYHLTR